MSIVKDLLEKLEEIENPVVLDSMEDATGTNEVGEKEPIKEELDDNEEDDELGLYIINDRYMYDHYCYPAVKKIMANNGDDFDIDWFKIAVNGGRRYAKEIAPLHLDGDGYKKTAAYIREHYMNMAHDNMNHPDYKKNESEEKIAPSEIYDLAVKELPAEDIDHHATDLYLRKTDKSTALVDRLENKAMLSTFISNIEPHDTWYELPFCYPFIESVAGKLLEDFEETESQEVKDAIDLYKKNGLLLLDDEEGKKAYDVLFNAGYTMKKNNAGDVAHVVEFDRMKECMTGPVEPKKPLDEHPEDCECEDCKKARGSKLAQVGESKTESVNSNWEQIDADVRELLFEYSNFTNKDGVLKSIEAHIYRINDHEYKYEVYLGDAGSKDLLANGNSDFATECISLCIDSIKEVAATENVDIEHEVKPLEPDAEDIKFIQAETITEVSKDDADDVLAQRQLNALIADGKAAISGQEEDKEKADELVNKANKSILLNKKWKEAKGITESKTVVASFDNGLHEIVRCDKGYYNKYNITEGKAKFRTGFMHALPTALGALKKRFPEAEQDNK